MTLEYLIDKAIIFGKHSYNKEKHGEQIFINICLKSKNQDFKFNAQIYVIPSQNFIVTGYGFTSVALRDDEENEFFFKNYTYPSSINEFEDELKTMEFVEFEILSN